jgi:two-component system, NarL family, nitrate/nitrite response regulator NarL
VTLATRFAGNDLIAGKAVIAESQIVRIVMAHVDPIFLDGLRRLLETEPRLHVVGKTAGASDAVGLVRELKPDLLLLDLSARGSLALKILQELAESETPVRTIVLSESADRSEVTDALKLGARGVVLKDSAAEALFNSIRGVMAGHYWIDRNLVSDTVAGLRKLDAERRRQRAFGLTRRELEIVRAVVSGSTNKEIARRFSISENTVKRHLTHIFDKVGASNRVELLLFAGHHGLLGV